MTTTHEADTKTLILDAAEQAFAEQGFGAASLRHIIRAAKVNLAAVHYHFGSKDALVEAVFARRIGGLTAERLALLDACEAAAGRKAPSLTGILEAFVGPALRMISAPEKGGRVFVRLFGRTITEPSGQLQRLLNQQFGTTIERFLAALKRALPQLSPELLCWRFQFVVGAMGYLMADPQDLKALSEGRCDPANTKTAIRELVVFLEGGLRAKRKIRIPKSEFRKNSESREHKPGLSADILSA
jgi:AcrR family transcriptional regulator